MLRIPPPKRQIGVRHHLPFASRILRGRQLHTLTFRPGASLARQTVGSHLRVIASAGHAGRVNCASASSQEKYMISAEDIGRTRRVAADVDAGVFGDANATGGCCERRSHVSWIKLSGTVCRKDAVRMSQLIADQSTNAPLMTPFFSFPMRGRGVPYKCLC